MFLENYLDENKYECLFEIYEDDYIYGLDQTNFEEVYLLFKKYKFYYIDDIILNYLEIFQMDVNEIENKILLLKKKLGTQYVYIIGNDLRYLEIILDD